MHRSIRFKLIATYLALAAVSIIVVMAVVLPSVHQRYLKSYEYIVVTQARLVSTMLTRTAADRDVGLDEMQEIAQQFKWRPDAAIAILDRFGGLPGEVAGTPLPPLEVALALAGRVDQAHAVRLDPVTRQQRVFAAAPVGPPNAPVAIVHVSVPAIWAWRQVQRLLPWFGGALVLGLGAAFLVGTLLARQLTEPVKALTKAAERLREGHLDTHVDVRSGDEIGRLGEAFGLMARRLRETIDGLTQERNRVEAILTSMVEAVVAVDRQGNFMLLNRAAEDLIGASQGAAVGRPAATVLPVGLSAVLDEARVQEKVSAVELPAGNGDRVLEVHCAPIKGQGTVAGAVAVVRDVTELRRSEHARRELTANVSHELRTPLTSIKGFAETLLSGAMRDEATCRRFLEIIDAEANRLVKLVDDLMDLSRLESKVVTLDLAPVPLPDLIDETVAHLRPLAGMRRVEVDRGNPHVVVMADRDRVAQVLTNLIDNAIKFTGEDGRVEIGWATRNGEVEVTVKDDGRGIPAVELPHVFERFFRVDRSRARRRGTGLGLAITRHIVEAHGGRIAIRSQVDRGTIVTFTLPLALAEDADQPLDLDEFKDVGVGNTLQIADLERS